MSSDSYHRRCSSGTSTFRLAKEDIPPLPPPRSAPSTFRKRRRDVGDRVFITSPTVVLLNYVDDNSRIVEELKECEKKLCVCGEKKCKCSRNRFINDGKSKRAVKESCDNNDSVSNIPSNFVKLKCTSVGEAEEFQEINLFIGRKQKSLIIFCHGQNF